MSKRFWRNGIVVLAAALIGTNIFWFHALLDSATILKARDQLADEYCRSLGQAMRILPALSGPSSRDDIIRASSVGDSEIEVFEKDGATWIGWLGFRFDDDGTIEQVLPLAEPFGCP